MTTEEKRDCLGVEIINIINALVLQGLTPEMIGEGLDTKTSFDTFSIKIRTKIKNNYHVNYIDEDKEQTMFYVQNALHIIKKGLVDTDVLKINLYS